MNSSSQIKTEMSIQESSEANVPFRLKNEQDQIETHSLIKSSPSSSHQSSSNSKRDKETNSKPFNESDSLIITDNSIEMDATHREFYNHIYNHILSTKSPISPPNPMMPFSNNYFLNQLQTTLFKNNFQSQLYNNKDCNNNNSDYFNFNNISNHSKSSKSHSSNNSCDSSNKESKSCNGNLSFTFIVWNIYSVLLISF